MKFSKSARTLVRETLDVLLSSEYLTITRLWLKPGKRACLTMRLH